jgi:hypothetical protein
MLLVPSAVWLQQLTEGERRVNVIARSCLGIAIAVALAGCVTIRTNTKAPAIPDTEVPKLSVQQPIALRNAAATPREIIIGNWLGGKAYGDLNAFTESSIGAAEAIFARQGIEVTESADRVLALAVSGAKAEQGMVKFRATTTLSVETGDGLRKEFSGTHNYPNGYGTTFAIERALAQCVAKMLNDKDIIRYLEE